ncbi:ketosynthase [Lysobacter silvisoli]|uniref:Ketosynthase n=1 Tax=Lysobacter silvisoli TaxID=2293254 RepID=A0A371JXJ3_9GAMM|nr:ketosynthase [Lysobacter silvisoli]RDZ26385.1 ketosynthase [Lysobacter silvisoli]
MTAAVLRLLLAVAYPLLAHWASHDGGGWPAVLALVDLALIVQVDGLLALRAGPWALFAAIVAGLAALADTVYPQLLLLTPPVLFTAALAWWFGRSLRAPREGLITRIVAALDGCAPAQLPADVYRYSRRLTAAWAWLLGGLALANAALATIAVPGGVLARLGQAPPVAITQDQWSWFANLLNYGIVGGFFIGEYLWRQRRFRDRPYTGFFDFLRKMAKLGPAFWRGLFD